MAIVFEIFQNTPKHKLSVKSLFDKNSVTDSLISKISKNLDLSFVDLSGCKITDDALQDLALNCWKIIHLDLNSLPLFQETHFKIVIR